MHCTLGGVTVSSTLEGVAVGLCLAERCLSTPNNQDGAAIDDAVAKAVAQAQSAPPSETVKGAVRDLLRFGKYKPSGRGKPASEYLQQAAKEGAFPRVSPLVDLCNVVSLASALPISLIDLGRAETKTLCVRRGRAGESYVFNASGQSIALEDLLLTARLPDDTPIANAVKDSLATKLPAPDLPTPARGLAGGPGLGRTHDVLAVIYAPHALQKEAAAAAGVLATHYRDLLGAGSVAHALLPGAA